MGLFKSKKYKCFICNKGVGETSPKVRYKYEQDQIGTVRLCNKCATKFETENDSMQDAFNEPF